MRFLVNIKKDNVTIIKIHNAVGDFGRVQIASKELLPFVGKKAEVTITVVS